MYGGITQSRIAYLNFMENNQATAFKNHLEAKVKALLFNLSPEKSLNEIIICFAEKTTRSSNG